MVNGSEVRVVYPSVSFFFAHLGVALGVSGDFLPWLRIIFLQFVGRVRL